MSATVYSPSETLIEDYSKPTKHRSKSISLLTTAQLQSSYCQQLPSIGLVMPGNQLPQVKNEDSSSAVSYFNNPFPVYYLAQNRRDTEMTSLYLGLCSTTYNASLQTSNVNYIPATMLPQNSYSTGQNLFPPPPPQLVVKKASRVSKNQDRCTCKRLENHIPRPRNAFILFRQKHHQSVLKELEDLKTNPEVSRELARRWKALSQEERSKWNSLAEQEKRDHAQKYPNYRYKPRRHKKCSECSTCGVKRAEAQQAAQPAYAAYTDFTHLILGQDVKVQKLPLMLQIPQQLVQIQQQSQGAQTHQGHQHQGHQSHPSNLQHHLPQQHQQQQVPLTDVVYQMLRYVPYSNFHQQYSFADGSTPQMLLILGQQTAQQQYQLHQQRSHLQQHTLHMQPNVAQHQHQHQHQQHQQSQQSQHHQRQPQHQPQHQLAIEAPGQGLIQGHNQGLGQDLNQDLASQSSQNGHDPSQGLVHSLQSSSAASSHSLTNPHMQAYAEKYHEPAAFQYPELAVQGQKYGSLPTPMSNNMYSSSDSFAVPTLLQLY